MQVDSELEPPQPSTSTATSPISATKWKFGYRQGLPLRAHISAAERRQRPIETSFVRCCMMSALVRGLACTKYSEWTLKIRAIDRRLGLGCLLETLHHIWGSTELNAVVRPSRRWESRQRAFCCCPPDCGRNHGHGRGPCRSRQAVSLHGHGTGRECGKRSGRLKHRRRLHGGPAGSLVRLKLRPVTMPLDDSRANPELWTVFRWTFIMIWRKTVCSFS